MKPVIIVLSLAAGLALTGCGSDDDGKDAASIPDHNGADVAFVRRMIPHHEQAAEMARLAPAKAESPLVRDLARRIEGGQGPQIETMQVWLSGWGEKAVETGRAGASVREDAGLTSEQEMVDLRAATGAAYDRLFLDMMIRHHESATAMADRELSKGRFGEAKRMAAAIRDAQRAEVAEMNDLLARSPE